ncbi:hypothetical protein H0H92_005059 [Tricholoma furcatifolium]|nr:hypothetical protein H0H92_005059 [Tricholoma furcatifolium]
MSSDQCALGPNGTLLDAQDIVWYNDPDDKIPISSGEPRINDSGQEPCRTRNRTNEKMSMATATLKLDEYGALTKKYTTSTSGTRTRARTMKHGKTDRVHVEDDDSEDKDFSDEDNDSESDDDEENTAISNVELAESLPSKIIPTTGRHSGK